MQPYRGGLALIALVSIALNPRPALADGVTVHQCKSYVQARIDALDAQMHKGDKAGQGRKLVERRDRLREQLADCEKNPKAYKKNL